MKLLSWNVNGARAVWRKGVLQEWLQRQKADVYCLQETKAQPDQLAP
ncbi:MAG: endonuclease/exonuclease/phosphatase family protein, partial [Elusimicrobiota bacterium]